MMDTIKHYSLLQLGRNLCLRLQSYEKTSTCTINLSQSSQPIQVQLFMIQACQNAWVLSLTWLFFMVDTLTYITM